MENGLDFSCPVMVVGAGIMGSGIAQVAAAAGHRVYLLDVAPGVAARARERMDTGLQALVDKGRLTQPSKDALMERVHPIEAMEHGRDALLLIEAVVERLEVKQQLLTQAETLLSPQAILATNTSSLSITAIAAGLKRPGQVVGMHFFNPAPRMPLVEVVSGLSTHDEVINTIFHTAKTWGKIPVRVRSTPGFIVNRVARPYYAEAWRVVQEGAVDYTTADTILRECAGFAMGPFALMDLIGHDTNYAVTQSVHAAYYGDPRYTPSLLQQELVLAGRLGRKSGQGIYTYHPEASVPVARKCPPMQTTQKISVQGDAALIQKLRAHHDLASSIRLCLTDGRSATQRSAEERHADLVLFDLRSEAMSTIALARSDACGPDAWNACVAACQAAGLSVLECGDIAGMVAMRTVCMLANEAADAVLQGVATACDVDSAMRHGVNYPLGPLAWAQALGLSHVVTVLRHLLSHYGEPRYRVSPLLQRKVWAGQGFDLA